MKLHVPLAVHRLRVLNHFPLPNVIPGYQSPFIIRVFETRIQQLWNTRGLFFDADLLGAPSHRNKERRFQRLGLQLAVDFLEEI